MHIDCCMVRRCCVAGMQGRFSFYMTCTGEEATVVGSAAGLDSNDMVSCGHLFCPDLLCLASSSAFV